ncbi:MAG: adenylate/guanylate cyclase domain-containing protein, partial [Acidimicrobiia bacterium]
MEREVRFCKTSDGVRIAYATIGSGPPVVYVPGWISHLELNWQIPQYREGAERLAQHFTSVSLDKRGTGLSDRGTGDYSQEARVLDVEAVVDHLGLDRFHLAGISEGGPTCITYAARHPERVLKMHLYGTFARGEGLAGGNKEMQSAILSVVKTEWGIGSKLLADYFLGSDADLAMAQWFSQYQQAGATAEDAYVMLEADMAIDVTDLLPEVKCPTQIVHARGDRIVPIELGQDLAAGIPGAVFHSIDGVHAPLDPEQSRLLQDLEFSFLLGRDSSDVASAGSSASTPGGLVTILFTDMESSTALTQRLGDDAAQELVHTHNNVVRDALKAHDGSEIKHTGDGIMASFPSARGALDAAIAIQRAFEERNRSVRAQQPPEDRSDVEAGSAVAAPLHVRIGLNAGEPVAEDDPDGRVDLFGTSVQLAARVCAEADAGEILVSNVV